MGYNADRKGLETKDGGLIRINGSGDKVRIDIYDKDERKPNHTRDSINLDTKKGEGKIDSHNGDKSEKSSTDVKCYLTTACMKHQLEEFDDNCYELFILRWFRDTFIPKREIDHYYEVAPTIVEKLNEMPECEQIYNYIYENVISACVNAIKHGDFEFAYNRYKNSILALEEYINPTLKKEKSKVLTTQPLVSTH